MIPMIEMMLAHVYNGKTHKVLLVEEDPRLNVGAILKFTDEDGWWWVDKIWEPPSEDENVNPIASSLTNAQYDELLKVVKKK